MNDLHLSDIVEAVIARERSRARDSGVELATRPQRPARAAAGAADTSWSRPRRARDDGGFASRPAISWSELMAEIGRAPSGTG